MIRYTTIGRVLVLLFGIGAIAYFTSLPESVTAENPRHQPGQSTFRSLAPDDVDWKPFAAFPAAARLAVLVGDPSAPSPYVIRVKAPAGVRLMPHRHPEDRVYTVISGIFYIGLGETFDADKLVAYPPGSVVVLPGGTPHFHWAKSGEYITQISAIGPLGLEYVNPGDDPRNASRLNHNSKKEK